MDGSQGALDQNLTNGRFLGRVWTVVENKRLDFAGLLTMELAGLEPATSWVRSRRSPS